MAPTATFDQAASAPASAPAATKAAPAAADAAPVDLDLVLDYADLTATGERREAFVSDLRKAMIGLGFFYLKNSPLEAERQRIFGLSRKFFDLPVEDKQTIRQTLSKRFRGYSGCGTEYTHGALDNREQIDFALEAPEFAHHLASSENFLTLYGPNPFPDTVMPELREAVLSYMDKAEETMVTLVTGLEDALGLTRGRLNDLVALCHKQDVFSTIRSLVESWEKDGKHELAREEVDGVLPQHLPYERLKLVKYGKEGNPQGVGAHRDGSCITLLATDEQRGLQVEDLSGQWLDVPFRENCIVVNFGQQLERLSSGLVRAATHRVRLYPSPTGRISIPFFSGPGLRTVVPIIPRSEMSAEAKAVFESTGRQEGRKSEVAEGDLHGEKGKPYGLMAWEVLRRSHPETYQIWYGDAKA